MAEPSQAVEQFDAVVIGSGFGGAVAACRLSQAGFSVLLLERGRRYQAQDFPALPDDDRIAPDLRRWVWSNEQGLWDLQDLGEIVAVQAAGYGGGSLLYANVHLRAAEGTFEKPHWPRKLEGGALEPFYDLAAHMLNVAPIAERPGAPFVKTTKFDEVTAKLGRKTLRPPLAISYERGKNAFGEEQGACNGCGKCCTGCPEGAKNTLDHNYLAVAEQNGAVARTQCEVKRIRQGAQAEAEARWHVEYVNHLTASYVTVSAKNVFLCAGSVNSTRLLREASLRPDSEAVRERVGLGYFPNADAAGMVYDTHDQCFPSSGPCITTSVVHWEADAQRTNRRETERKNRLFMIQDGGYAPELERLLGVLRAPVWNGRNRVHDATPGPVVRPTPRAPTPLPGVALVSPLDALLDASSEPKVKEMAPAALGRSWEPFLREVGRALLMPSVVAATIERSAKARYERFPGWLKRRVGYDSWPVRAFKSSFQWFIDFTGGNDEVGHHALAGVLGGSDLDRNVYLRDIAGYDAENATRRMMLLAMGEDAAPGALVFDEKRGMVADLDLFHLVPGYTNQELLMKDMARELGGELRLNPAWSFFGKPITVHSQGGCGMSEDPKLGVTDPQGQVHGCPGLFVMDGAVLCRSVGVNPTPTILAISELNVLHFIQAHRGAGWPHSVTGELKEGADQYLRHREGARQWRERAARGGWQLRPPRPDEAVEVPLQSEPLGIKFREKFHGYCAPIDAARDPVAGAQPARRGDGCEDVRRPIPARADTAHRLLEIEGRPQNPFSLELTARCRDLNLFFEDCSHRLELEGDVTFTLPGLPQSGSKRRVRGFLELFAERRKPYGLPESLRDVQTALSDYQYLTIKGEPESGAPRFMRYYLSVEGDELRLEGYKRVRNDPGVDAWRDTTALFTRFGRPKVDAAGVKRPLGEEIEPIAAGVLHVNLTDFVYDEIASFETSGGERCAAPHPPFEVVGTTDPARMTWAAAKFASFFFGSLQRIYSPSAVSVLDAVLQPVTSGLRHERPARRV